MSLSPQLQKLCQQAEQEKDFRKLLSLVSQINQVLNAGVFSAVGGAMNRYS